MTDIGAHTYGPWTVTVEPTTTAPGVQQHVCTVCGHAQTAALAQIPVIAPIPGVPDALAPVYPVNIDGPETPLAEPEPVENIAEEPTPLSREHVIGCIIHWILLASALIVLVVYIVSAENEKKKIKALKEQLGI